jgi:hypothetical protein
VKSDPLRPGLGLRDFDREAARQASAAARSVVSCTPSTHDGSIHARSQLLLQASAVGIHPQFHDLPVSESMNANFRNFYVVTRCRFAQKLTQVGSARGDSRYYAVSICNDVIYDFCPVRKGSAMSREPGT